MTRTPPDMETAMSDQPFIAMDHGTEPPSSVIGVGDHVINTEDMGVAISCFHALSALGDPVVVAEALPELVDAAKGMIGVTPVLDSDGGRALHRLADALKQLED